MNVLLYISTLFIWGGSWLAIKWQTGPVPIPVSIFYRFALAAMILMLIMLVFRRMQKTTPRDHLFFILQGACLFSFNFIAFYSATTYIASGLVAVAMSTATLFNAIHNQLFWKIVPSMRFRIGAPVGIVGLIVMLWADLESNRWSMGTVAGMGFSLLGTWLFSLGNMVSVRHTRVGIRPATSNAWSMGYGCIILLLLIGIKGEPMVWDDGARYLGALLYLAIFASVIGFSTYLMLVARMGANSAAYTLVATPVVALGLSTLFEGFQWNVGGVFGLGMIVIGNVIVLSRYGERRKLAYQTT